MPTNDYSTPQSDLSFSKKKCMNMLIILNHLLFKILLAVVSNTNKRNDNREPITMCLQKQRIEALPTICSSYIEAILFASICSLAFFGFVENRRSSLIWNIGSYFRS